MALLANLEDEHFASLVGCCEEIIADWVEKESPQLTTLRRTEHVAADQFGIRIVLVDFDVALA